MFRKKPQDSSEVTSQSQASKMDAVESRSKVFENFQVDESKKEPNLFFQILMNTRRSLKHLFFSKSRRTKILWASILNVVAVILIAASVIHITERDEEVDWCHGEGFLWLIVGLVYLGVVYHIIKLFLGRYIPFLFSPIYEFFYTLLTKRPFQYICSFSLPVAMGLYVTLSPGKSGKRKFSFFGMLVFIFLGFLFSKYPTKIRWRPVVCGLFLQLIFGWLTIRMSFVRKVMNCLGEKMTAFLEYSETGSQFVYGYLAHPQGDNPHIFAFSVLPAIFFFSFFVSILNHYRTLHILIVSLSRVMKLLMGTTVCESVIAASSIFLSMVESPLLIKNYLNELTKSEICAILCAGWSTVNGVILAAYIKFGLKASHLITASIMSAPASLSVSKLLYPETEISRNTVDNFTLNKREDRNVLEAASRGAVEGVIIIGSIVANLVAFLGFAAFVDGTLHWIGKVVNFQHLSIELLLSKIFYPVSFLMGVEEDSLEEVAYLVGIKTITNEFQAYQLLGELVKQKRLSERTEIITTYALCGFSNFGSIGITIGAMSSIAPQHLPVIAEVTLIAFISANMVCFLTACIAGCLIE